MKEDKSIEWVDVIKGLGITSVVAGHVFSREDVNLIFMFHMPLFFFISGYLYKPNLNYSDYAWRKSLTFLVPYVAFLIFMLVPMQIRYLLSTKESLANGLIEMLLGGRYLSGYGAVFWFVTAFFVTQQMFNYFFTTLKRRSLYMLACLLLVLAYINSGVFSKFWLPWNLNVIFFAFPIVLAGVKYKQLKKVSNLFLLLGAVFTISVILFYESTYSIDMKYANYGVPGLSLIGALYIIHLFVILSKRIVKVAYLRLMFTSLGRASMLIMYLHLPLKILIAKRFGLNEFSTFILCLLVSFLIYILFTRFTFTRAIFLGSQKDIKNITMRFLPNAFAPN